MGYFCPPGSGSGFRIRIPNPDPDPQPWLEVPAPANGGRYLVLESAGGLRYAQPDQIQPDQRNTVLSNNYLKVLTNEKSGGLGVVSNNAIVSEVYKIRKLASHMANSNIAMHRQTRYNQIRGTRYLQIIT